MSKIAGEVQKSRRQKYAGCRPNSNVRANILTRPRLPLHQEMPGPARILRCSIRCCPS